MTPNKYKAIDGKDVARAMVVAAKMKSEALNTYTYQDIVALAKKT
jgi:hypothetical protein